MFCLSVDSLHGILSMVLIAWSFARTAWRGAKAWLSPTVGVANVSLEVLTHPIQGDTFFLRF